jgi:hypothetical protein
MAAQGDSGRVYPVAKGVSTASLPSGSTTPTPPVPCNLKEYAFADAKKARG